MYLPDILFSCLIRNHWCFIVYFQSLFNLKRFRHLVLNFKLPKDPVQVCISRPKDPVQVCISRSKDPVQVCISRPKDPVQVCISSCLLISLFNWQHLLYGEHYCYKGGLSFDYDYSPNMEVLYNSEGRYDKWEIQDQVNL